MNRLDTLTRWRHRALAARLRVADAAGAAGSRGRGGGPLRGIADDLAMALLFALTLWAGRLIRPPGGSHALLLLSAGVAMVWFYPYARRSWRGSAPALALTWLVSLAINAATGAGVPLSAAYGVANVVMGVVAAAVFARQDPAGSRRIESPRRFYMLCLAALAGSVASAPIGVGASMLIDGGPITTWRCGCCATS